MAPAAYRYQPFMAMRKLQMEVLWKTLPLPGILGRNLEGMNAMGTASGPAV